MELLDTLADVAGELDDFDQLAVAVIHRVVTRLQPHHAAVLANALELPGEKFTIVQASPKVSVLRTVDLGRFAKHTVMFAFEFRQRIPHDREEILVGVEYLPVQVKL